MMVKAHVSPGFFAKTKPQIEQRSKNDHPENNRPSPQCGQRFRSPRPSAVPINFGREGTTVLDRSSSFHGLPGRGRTTSQWRQSPDRRSQSAPVIRNLHHQS
jgi:hypothetical protein